MNARLKAPRLRLGMLAALVLSAGLLATGLASAAGGSEQPGAHRRAGITSDLSLCNWLGQVMLVGFDYKTTGTEPAAGQALEIRSNTALFTLLGYKFGGVDGKSFKLPDLQGKAPRGLHYLICTSGTFPARESVARRAPQAAGAPSVAAKSLSGRAGPSASASVAAGSCNYLGQAILVAYGFNFRGTVAADGELLSKTGFPRLFALWGNRFGDASDQMFAAPNLRGKAPEGLQYRICAAGLYPGNNSMDWCNWLGQVVFNSFNVSLNGTFPADGESVPINANSALYLLFGNTFGGNRDNGTFGLPDLRDQAPPGFDYRVCGSGPFPSHG